MITKFSSLYAGHVDLGDMGQDATPANERRYSNEHLMTVFSKTENLAKSMGPGSASTRCGSPSTTSSTKATSASRTSLMLGVHLAHVTERLRIGCGFNICPMWHPLRLAEDYATADVLTDGRVIFGVGRGYHTREVETLGGVMMDQALNREMFEEQVDLIFKAFNNESFSHQGKHYTIPPKVPYRGYELEELSLVPRPKHLPVECWQPIVSANPRGLDFMVKHGIRGIVGGGSALLGEGPVAGYRDALARAGIEAELGEGICVGVNFYLADSQEQAVREATPYYEEHAKMFAPLGFFRGLTDEQAAAVARRGGWADADFPTIDRQMQSPLVVLRHRRGDGRLSPGASGAVPGTGDRQRAVEHGHAGVGDAGAAGAVCGGGDAGVSARAGGERGGVGRFANSCGRCRRIVPGSTT